MEGYIVVGGIIILTGLAAYAARQSASQSPVGSQQVGSDEETFDNRADGHHVSDEMSARRPGARSILSHATFGLV
jgi:hypothetical protein